MIQQESSTLPSRLDLQRLARAGVFCLVAASTVPLLRMTARRPVLTGTVDSPGRQVM